MTNKLVVRTLALLALLVLVVFASSGVVAAPLSASDAYSVPIPGEPNDTFATATRFETDYWRISTYLMTPDDIDYFQLDLPVAHRVSPDIHIRGYDWDTPPPVLRVKLALLNAESQVLAEDADCGEDPVLPKQYLAAGMYYLRVTACANQFESDRPYSLEVNRHQIEWEPNNSRTTANVFDDVEGAITPAGDVDFYQFAGQAGEHWYARLDTIGAGFPPGVEPEMALMTSDGTVLQTSGLDYMYFDLPATGDYYLRVRSATHPSGTGEYRLYGEKTTSGTEPPGPVDVEPNDTPAQAGLVTYGQSIGGTLSTTDVVDYYRFEGQAGDKIALPLSDRHWDHEVALFDPSMNPLPLKAYSRWTSLPMTGVYTLAITNENASPWGTYYSTKLFLLTGDEPNDSIDIATPIEFGPVLNVFYDYPCDVDWFSFQGRAGDVLAYINTEYASENVDLYSSDGERLYGVNLLPADGTYYLRTMGLYADMHDSECYEGAETHLFGEALWVSASANGLGGDMSIKRGDIVTRKNAPNTWQVVFDASDVGITRNIVAFEQMPNGSILMSLDREQNVAGLGKVMPQDIIRFSPTSLGDNTAGTFDWFLDGSDVGLTTSGENIDVIIMQRDVENPLRISTTGSGNVPRQSGGTLKFADEDLINFVGTSYGANSAGAWRMSLDGSTVPGMKAEDLNAGTRIELYPQRTSDVLFSFASAFNIDGNKGTPKDVVFDESWQTAVKNLTDKTIDGLAVGPAWTP